MKKTALILGLFLSGTALSATKTSTVESTGSDSATELSRWSAGISSTFLQSPDSTKGTERVYGLGLEVQREIKLKGGISTSTIANIGTFSNEDGSTDTESDGSVYKDSYDSNFRQISISQSLTKNLSTKLGTLSIGGSLGFTEHSSEGESDYKYTDSSDSEYNYSGSSKAEFKAYGKTIGLLTSLRLNNGIMPFMSYSTTSFNDARVTIKGDSGTEYSKIKDLNIQTVSMGLGYKF